MLFALLLITFYCCGLARLLAGCHAFLRFRFKSQEKFYHKQVLVDEQRQKRAESSGKSVLEARPSEEFMLRRRSVGKSVLAINDKQHLICREFIIHQRAVSAQKASTCSITNCRALVEKYNWCFRPRTEPQRHLRALNQISSWNGELRAFIWRWKCSRCSWNRLS
jgi:hypothetical protein